MKIGLDNLPLVPLFEWDTLEFMDKAAEYGYDGVAISGRELSQDEGYRQQVKEKKEELGLYLEMGGAGIDSAMSGRSTQELVAGWKPRFDLASELGVEVLVTGLGTWPWQGRTMKEEGKSVEDQINGGIATLKELRGMAEDHEVAVAIHTAFFTAEEYAQIMEAVDSPYIGLCLDTANAFLVLEDPTEFAQKVAPWVKATHFKDSSIYLHPEGMYWFGGSALGRGSVDLLAIVEIIYENNADADLTIEDHWGRSSVPALDKEFLNSFPDWNGSQVANLLKHLQQGDSSVKSGLYPTLEESGKIDWKKVFPERARYNAIYAKQLRDEVAACEKKEND